MRLQRFRFTVRQMMAWMVIAAIASVMASEIWSPFPPPSERLDFMIGAAVSVAVGMEARRHPLRFLAFTIVLWICAPAIDHGFNAATLSAQGGALAWMIGASWGWLSGDLPEETCVGS